MPKPASEFTVEEKCRMFDEVYERARYFHDLVTQGWTRTASWEDFGEDVLHILLGEENGW